MYFPEEGETPGVGPKTQNTIYNTGMVQPLPPATSNPNQIRNQTYDHAHTRNDANFTNPSNSVQETDNEALSSLLMLSKSNAEQPMKVSMGHEVRDVFCELYTVYLYYLYYHAEPNEYARFPNCKLGQPTRVDASTTNHDETKHRTTNYRAIHTRRKQPTTLKDRKN